MKQFFLFVHLFLLFHSHIEGQNLVPNPSFEEYVNGCPENWHDMPSGWSFYRDSPNSFSTCVQPESLSDSLGWAPLNGFGYQVPAHGESYIGLSTYGGPPFKGYDFREFIGTELLEPLEVGAEYHFSMKVVPAVGDYYYYIQWFSNNIGMQLTMSDYDWLDDPMPINNFAHVYESSIITDTTNWTVVEGSFIAEQAFTHIAIGNFFTNANTDTLWLGTENSLGAYFFVDDLCLSKNKICTTIPVNESGLEKMDFFPNPSSYHCQAHCSSKVLHVQLVDICGRLLSEAKWTWQNGTLICDVSNYPSGTYIVIIEHERGVSKGKISVL